jgi:hypothetical protein
MRSPAKGDGLTLRLMFPLLNLGRRKNRSPHGD